MIFPALQVYLDSSDISSFAHPPQGRATELEEIEAYLVAKQREGHIQLRFSEAHIIEAAATSDEAIPAASARLEKIQELCGTHCLLHFLDLASEEIQRTAEHRSISRRDVLRDDGFWYPSVIAKEFLLSPEALLNQFIHLGRKERRDYLKDGRLSPRGQQIFGSQITQAVQEIAKNLPLSKKDVEICQRYYLGALSRSEAEQALRRSISDVNAFAKWYEIDSKAAMRHSSILRSIGGEFKSALDAGREDYSQLLEEAARSAHSEEQVNRHVKETFTESLQDAIVDIAEGFAESIGVPLNISRVDCVDKSFPGIACVARLSLQVARRSVLGANPRQAKTSDFGDIYHAVYIPYVDLYRTDAFMADLIREARIPGSTVAVGRLSELPSAIDQALRNCENVPKM